MKMKICRAQGCNTNTSVFWLCVGEGFAGALHWKELIELCKEVGFSGPYLVTSRPIEAEPELKKSLGRFIRGGYQSIFSDFLV